MSLEDQIGRLANSIAECENLAVREIIRQRDAAIRERDEEKRSREYYKERTDHWYERMQEEKRKNAALRGVITRMKSREPRP